MSPVVLFMGLSGGEIFIVILAVVVLFGAKRIPELARGLGRGMREFKDATQNIQREINTAMEEPPKREEKKETPEIAPPPGAMPRSGYTHKTDGSGTPDSDDGVKP